MSWFFFDWIEKVVGEGMRRGEARRGLDGLGGKLKKACWWVDEETSDIH